MKTVQVGKVIFKTERFANWSKQRFISIYGSHVLEAGKVFDLIQKVNGEAIKVSKQVSEVRPESISKKGGRKRKD